MLGNMIAVASIIAVVSIVDGMNVYVQEKVFEQASGLLSVQRVDEFKILTDLDAFLESIYNPPITLDDREWLRERLVNAAYVGASRQVRQDVTRGAERLRGVPIRGLTADYPFWQQIELAAGRHFTEFETALKGASRKKEVDCLSMIGLCRMEKGDPAGAAQAFRRALRSTELRPEAARAIHYELASAYEAQGDSQAALWYLNKVTGAGGSFRDAAARLRKLGGGPGRPPPEPASAAPPPRGGPKNIGYV
jgi:hypothetical protein